VNSLDPIENRLAARGIGTSQWLTVAFGVPIAASFETRLLASAVAAARAGGRLSMPCSLGFLEGPGNWMAGRTAETFPITSNPHPESRSTTAVHPARQSANCADRRVDCLIRNQVHELRPGDGLTSEAHLAHRWLPCNPTLPGRFGCSILSRRGTIRQLDISPSAEAARDQPQVAVFEIRVRAAKAGVSIMERLDTGERSSRGRFTKVKAGGLA
jgi:hypothetical protein